MCVGRWRVDHATGSAGILQPVEWFATEEQADARMAELKLRGHDRRVKWWWPSEYHETPAEEATRIVTQQLTARISWLKLDQGDAA